MAPGRAQKEPLDRFHGDRPDRVDPMARLNWLSIADNEETETRSEKTMDDRRREFFQYHFPRLGQWFMNGKPDQAPDCRAKLRAVRRDLWKSAESAEPDEQRALAEAIRHILLAEQWVGELDR